MRDRQKMKYFAPTTSKALTMVDMTQAMQESWNSQTDAINSWGELSGEEQSNLATFYQAGIAEGRRQMREEAWHTADAEYNEMYRARQASHAAKDVIATDRCDARCRVASRLAAAIRAIPIGDE